MLRRTHVEPFLRVEHGRIEVELLDDPDGRAARFVERMARLLARLEGRPRRMVREALRRQERRVRDRRRLDGISKSLLDLCRFQPPPGAERAPEVRDALFRARGRLWPPTPGDAREPYRDAADALELEVEEVERLLYADDPAERVLVRAPAPDGPALLARYNRDLARGVLLDAERMTVTARGGWKGIFRALKLARLMYRIERRGRRTYRVEITGPAAAFVVSARRYGARFARVVPAVVRAPDWRIEAEVLRDGKRVPYRLEAAAGGSALREPRRRGRSRYDSGFERALAREFREKLGEEEREGWTLVREDRPLAVGEELFLPDFTLRHRDGREALVEIVGFWTPEYLERKLQKVAAADRDDLLLVVYRGLAAGEAEDVAERLEAVAPGRVLWFARKPVIRDVLEAAERVAG